MEQCLTTIRQSINQSILINQYSTIKKVRLRRRPSLFHLYYYQKGAAKIAVLPCPAGSQLTFRCHLISGFSCLPFGYCVYQIPQVICHPTIRSTTLARLT